MDNENVTPYYFVIEIDGIETARFQECDGLEMVTDVIEIEEGGYNTSTHKFRGKSRSPNIILKKGITDNNELLRWYQSCINGKFERKSGSVILKNTSHEELKRWNFFRAFPCRWVGPNLSTSNNGFAIETIELAYE